MLFACFCILASFGIGNMSQLNSIAGNMNAAFPTMANFFYICEYFNITPQEFFNFGEETSNGMNALVDQLKQFDAEQINALTAFIKTIVKK